MDLAAAYRDYLAAFNATDVGRLERHLSPDVVFDWRGHIPTMYGRDAMLGFYREAWTYFEETLTADAVEVHGDVLRVELATHLDVFRDWPDCPVAPMVAGVPIDVSGRLQYVYEGGRINHIIELLPPAPDERTFR